MFLGVTIDRFFADTNATGLFDVLAEKKWSRNRKQDRHSSTAITNIFIETETGSGGTMWAEKEIREQGQKLKSAKGVACNFLLASIMVVTRVTAQGVVV